MPQPFDYTLDIPDPSQTLMNAVSLKRGITDLRTAQTKQVASQQLQTDLAQLSQNPNPAAVAKMMTRYPQLSEGFKRTYDVLSEEQRNSRISQASGVYAALEAGESQIAQDLLEEQAEAYRNSGLEQEAKTLSDLAKLVELSPETAKTSTGLFLASAMGADEFTETFTKLQADRRATQLESADLTKKQAESHKAAVEANFAESQAAVDLQKKGWDITKIQEDIKIAKENKKLAALNAKAQRVKNEAIRKKTELQIEEIKIKRDIAVNQRAGEVEAARSNVDNMLNTIDDVLKTPLNVMENAMGPIDSKLPTLRRATADFEEKLTLIEAQSFVAQIEKMKGLGSLSDAEGKKLSASLQNFSLRQKPETLMENSREARRLLLKVRKLIAMRYGVPETSPDTPNVETSAEDLELLLQRYSGDQ